MKSSLRLSIENPRKIRKTVRISLQTQEKELSPEVKELNRQNSFSRRERLDAISTIHNDQEFINYLAERRKGIPVKEYRSKVLNTLKNRDKLLSEIRKLKMRKMKKISFAIQNTKQNEDLIQVRYTKNETRIRIPRTLLNEFSSIHSGKKTTNKNKKFKSLKKMFLFIFDNKQHIFQ